MLFKGNNTFIEIIEDNNKFGKAKCICGNVFNYDIHTEEGLYWIGGILVLCCPFCFNIEY